MTSSQNNGAGNSVPDRLPVELNLSDFLYEAIDTKDFIDITNWVGYFDTIPVDPYIAEGYRYKSIGWFRIKHIKAEAIKAIDEHIAEVNRLSGMTGKESGNYLSTGKPDW